MTQTEVLTAGGIVMAFIIVLILVPIVLGVSVWFGLQEADSK